MKLNFPMDTIHKDYNVIANNNGNIIARFKESPSDIYFIWIGPDRCEFKELEDDKPEPGLIRVLGINGDGCNIQFRATQSLKGKQKEKNLIATAFVSKKDLQYLINEMDKK